MADPLAVSLADRVGALQGAHPWMDSPLVATLAASTTTPQAAVAQGNVMQDSLQSTWGSVAGAWDDPALYAHDGAAVALRQYLSNSMNPAPIAQQDLTVTQRNLQAKGFGTGLPTDGTWGPEWQSALNSAYNAHTSDAYAGNRPLSVNAHKAAHGFLSTIMPGNLVHTVVGYAKALPRQVADAAADVVGGAVAIAGSATYGTEQALTGHGEEGIRASLRAGAQVGTDINTALGGKQLSPEEFYNRQTSGAQVINDIGSILAVTPGGVGEAGLTRAAQGVSNASRVGFYRGLTDVGSEASLAAAQRGPGVIARSLMRDTLAGRATRGAVLGAGVGAGTAAVQGGSITRGAEYGALGGAVGNAALGSGIGRRLTEKLPGGFVSNHPLQARTSPLVGKLLDADGLYYKTRTLLAQPYRIPVVRGTGQAYAATIPYGLFAAGQSTLASMGDKNNAVTQSIDSDTTLDPLDQKLRALTANLSGGHLSLGLNDLALFVHGDIPLAGQKGASSAAVGKAVDTISDHVNDVLGVVGANGAITRAMRAVHGKGWTPQQMIDTTFRGDTSAYNEFWTDKIQQLAVARHAEQSLRNWVEDNGGVAPAWTEKEQILQAAGSEAWNNADILDQHMNFLTTSGNPAATGELENRLRAQVTGALQEPEMAQRHGAAAYIAAKREAVAILHDPQAVKSLIDPAAWTTYAAHRQQAIANGLAMPKAPLRSWFGANSPLSAPGAIGLARLDTLSRSQALNKATEIEQRLGATGDVAEQNQIVAEAHDWLAHHGNFDARTLAVFHNNPTDDGTIPLIERMKEYAETLGAPVHLTADASPELRATVDRINSSGYQLWHGTDIGHHIRIDRTPLPLAASGITKARDIVSRFGLNPEHFRSSDIAAYRRDRLRLNLQDLIDTGKLPMPPHYTPDTLISDLRTNANAHATLGALPSTLFEASAKARKTLVAAQAQAQGATSAEVIEQMKNELAQYHDLRAIPTDVVRDVLTRTTDLPYATDLARQVHGTDGLPLFTRDQADLIHQAIIKSASETPGYMVGLGRVDDLLRAGFGLGGKDWGGPIGQAATRIGNRAALVGNAYGRLRDNFRFTMSPAFSARRVTKTNIKLAAEGFDPSVTPVKDLLEAGTYEAAHAHYAKLFPEHASPESDEFDRALHGADIFAIYQPRQYAARAAWEAKQRGWDDERTKDMLTKVFEYGTTRHGEGRTALERTTNTIFFPFSFEKTVLRNIGGYLLDRPAQLFALNAGLAAYQQFSQAHPGDPLASDYLKAHVPLLNEALRLNPFAHGLSLGEFGGINAPLLNLFLPQSWDNSKPGNLGLLGRLVPAMNDVNRMWKEIGQQSTIVHNALQNTYDYAADAKASNPFFHYRPTITATAQTQAAFKDRAKLIGALQPVLDANRHLGPGQQYTFSSDPSVDPALRGEVVSKAAVDQLLHELYPAYDPAGAAKYATEVQTKSKSFLDSVKGTPNFLAYASFADAVNKFRGYVQAGDYRDYPSQQAQLTTQLRQFAFAAALQGNNGEPDRGFTDWYNSTFAKALGPLTGAP